MSTYSVKYNIDAKPLGRGGAAKVYGCTRITDGERLAIKILSDKNDNGKVKRFRREIDVIVDIVNHGIDGVLPILDYDKDDLWYVMPLASSLRSIIDNYAKLQQTAIPVTTYRDEILQQNVEGFIMLADILEKIHTLGYVHRDIKPDNLYMWNGRYCIGDFGIVDLPTNTALTKKHDRLGAWNTIAPEVLRDARNATNKSDVYSLAKSLWMCLSLNISGFDGRYDYNASSMSLHDMPHLENAYLLDIDTLLYDATQEDPALRPSMKEFAKLLMEWKKSQSNFNLCNKKEWGFIYKALFSGFPLPIVSISENAEIVRILHFFARYTRLNYTMMPRGGGLTLKDASVSPEVGCIYLDFGCTFVCKPKQLVIRGFSDDETWNYIFLELEELKPILTYGENEEELVEDTPAHYVDCTYAVYGVYDYDIGEHLGDLNFADLLDDIGDGYAKYCFTFETAEWRSPFDIYKDLYLCIDGSIKELDSNDDRIFISYDKNKALRLLDQLNQRIADECANHGVADSNQQVSAKIHSMMQKAPTHLFTYRELEDAILSADDRKDNVVCIDEEGCVVVATDVDYHIYPVSYERFGAFKNYVGPYSKGTAKLIVNVLRSLFLQYLETGIEARYTEDIDNRSIKEIIRETKSLLDNYKNGVIALPI